MLGDEFIKSIRDEWPVIRQAPWTISLSVLLLTSVASGSIYLGLREILSHKNDLIQTLKSQLEADKNSTKPAQAETPRIAPKQEAENPAQLKRESVKPKTNRAKSTDIPPQTTSTIEPASPSVVQQAPGGINIGPGAVAPNPQVINNGPPRANLRFTEEMSALPSAGGTALSVHIFTDRSIPGAAIGLILSGPAEIDGNAIILKGAAATQFSWGQLQVSGSAIPNSFAVSVNIPAAFMPGQELIIPLKSQSEIHVVEIGPIGN